MPTDCDAARARILEGDYLAALLGLVGIRTARRIANRIAPRDLSQASAGQLTKLKLTGMQVHRIRSAFKLSDTCAFAYGTEPPASMATPDKVAALMSDLAPKRQEELWGIYLDTGLRLIDRVLLSKGTLNTTRTHPREILRPAILLGAQAVVLVHNHPSGSLTPSQDDVAFTRALSKAADVMGIDVPDHVIVTGGGFTSLRDKGLL